MLQLALFADSPINKKAEKAVNKNRQLIEKFFRFREEHRSELTDNPNPDLKKQHAREGKKALKALAEELGLAEYKVSYKPSDICATGFLALIGMWDGSDGIFISLSCGVGGLTLYRTVKHMSDWEQNNYLPEKLFFTNYEKALEKLYELRRCK